MSEQKQDFGQKLEAFIDRLEAEAPVAGVRVAAYMAELARLLREFRVAPPAGQAAPAVPPAPLPPPVVSVARPVA